MRASARDASFTRPSRSVSLGKELGGKAVEVARGGGDKTHSLVRFVNCCVLLWAAPDDVTELVQILKENVSFLFLLSLIFIRLCEHE